MRLAVSEEPRFGSDFSHHGRIDICYQQVFLFSTVSQDVPQRVDDGRATDKGEITTLSYPVYSHYEALVLNRPSG